MGLYGNFTKLTVKKKKNTLLTKLSDSCYVHFALSGSPCIFTFHALLTDA